jgi:hypothetical protein
MSKLLEFIIAHLAYLYDELGCRFADSQSHGANAVLVFEVDELRLRLIRDRGQIFADFQNKRQGSGNHWFSFGIIRQFVTGEVGGSEELDVDSARYIYEHFSDIKAAFSSKNVKKTEAALAEFELDRENRLFGN